MKLSRSELQLETIVSRIAAGELDLQPDFQRGEIWDRRRRQRLIDTILRDWYVPAVHIVVDDDSEVVLDGQQRLASIRDFFDDRFPVDGRFDPQSEFMNGLHGKKFSQLPESVRRSVRRFVLSVITLTEFQPEEPNELFFRLNQSYNLTPPEKRNALHGPARDRVRALVEQLESDGLLVHEVVGFSNGRLAYDDIIARTCVALEHNDLTIHINNNVVEEFYRKEDSFSARTIQRVERSGLNLLTQIRQHPGRVRFNKGSLFTWLVYLNWAPVLSTPVPVDLLTSFESDRLELRRGEYETESIHRRRTFDCIALYEDRVSYRVTDVSSVVIRDLILHLYSCLTFGTQPLGAAELLLSRLMSQWEAPLQALILEFLNQYGWGTDLGGAEA